MKTVEELITELQKLPPDSRIMILDSFNGGGYPREINLGPIPQKINETDQDMCGDCEELDIDTIVYVIGYGCY